jgi:hypothetical protein
MKLHPHEFKSMPCIIPLTIGNAVNYCTVVQLLYTNRPVSLIRGNQLLSSLSFPIAPFIIQIVQSLMDWLIHTPNVGSNHVQRDSRFRITYFLHTPPYFRTTTHTQTKIFSLPWVRHEMSDQNKTNIAWNQTLPEKINQAVTVISTIGIPSILNEKRVKKRIRRNLYTRLDYGIWN